MVLLMLAVLGAILGYRLGPTRRGYVALAGVSICSAAVQVGHLLTATSRASMTMLPLVIGTVVVAFMLVGAWVRRRVPDPPSA